MSPYHPNEKANGRHRYKNRSKPEPWMYVEALEDCHHFRKFVPEKVHIVGNAPSDKQAAVNFAKYMAKQKGFRGQQIPIYFHWAHNFFGWPTENVVETSHGFCWQNKSLEERNKVDSQAIQKAVVFILRTWPGV